MGSTQVRTLLDVTSYNKNMMPPIPENCPEDNTSPHPMTSLARRISFDVVEIREYKRILSDNPATSSGPPVGLGWDYSPEDTIILDLETYESYQCDARRSKRELAIPSEVRHEMLLDEGYSRQEIAKVVREIRKIRERRNISFHHKKYDPIAERVETVKRGVKGIIPGSKKLECFHSVVLRQMTSKGA
jgi:hypothetical protein